MKLPDFVNSFNRKFNEVSNFARYPKENISRILIRWGQNIYENSSLPGTNQENRHEKEKENTPSFAEKLNKREEYNGYISNGNGKHPPEYSNDFNGTAVQTLPKKLTKQQTNFSLLPPLKTNDKIRGRRGRYRIDDKPILDSEKVRLYKGIHVISNKIFCIKEYFLPESDFNQQEARKTKDEFEELASVNFKGEEGKDFRLITPWDAIADRDERRCYLITELVDNRITLREYLKKTQIPMTSKQVRKVLELVLVSLKYLHTDSKVNLPQTQRPHGNLSLDSLLISTDKLEDNTESEQFFIYLSDFALWENLFKQPNLKLNHPSVEKDLQDLGTVAFYLLHGRDKDSDYDYFLDPKNEKHWKDINDISLKNFIRRLLGLDIPFENAEEAHQQLLITPIVIENKTEKPEIKTEEEILVEHKNKYYKYIYILIIIILLSFIGGFIFKFFWQKLSNNPIVPLPSNYNQCIKQTDSQQTKNCHLTDINIITSEKNNIIVSIKKDKIWDFLLNSKGLVSHNTRLKEELKNRQPKLKNYQFRNIAITKEQMEDELKQEDVNFALSSDIDYEKEELTNNYTTVAYDGLVVFVAFSDVKREQNIPNLLNGSISMKVLRELYTNQISKIKGKEVKLYFPKDNPEAVALFEKKVLENDDKSIEEFKSLQQEIIKRERTVALDKQREIDKNLTKNVVLSDILQDFENNQEKISISFDFLSRVYGQCSVFPLAVYCVQPYIENKGYEFYSKTDLCDKGGYKPNVDAFNSESYPLAYKLIVIPSEDNEEIGDRFADMLLTEEGQTLLKEAGLVPIRKLNDN